MWKPLGTLFLRAGWDFFLVTLPGPGFSSISRRKCRHLLSSLPCSLNYPTTQVFPNSCICYRRQEALARYARTLFLALNSIRPLSADTATPNTYLLLLIYGVSTTTAGLPLLALLLSTPIRSAETIAAGIHSIPKSEHFRMLCNYTPILLIPLMVAVDMAFRLSHSIQNGAAKKKVT